MNPIPLIQTLPAKKLVGMRMQMSLAGNKTALLWQSFMPRRKEIGNRLNEDYYSVTIYSNTSRLNNPHAEFEKWAAAEVDNFSEIPHGMEALALEEGLYAVFQYKGSSNDTSIFRYIFTEWLPSSSYLLDHRPYFEILGSKYKNADPESEEEIWVPVKPKE